MHLFVGTRDELMMACKGNAGEIVAVDLRTPELAPLATRGTRGACPLAPDARRLIRRDGDEIGTRWVKLRVRDAPKVTARDHVRLPSI